MQITCFQPQPACLLAFRSTHIARHNNTATLARRGRHATPTTTQGVRFGTTTTRRGELRVFGAEMTGRCVRVCV